MTQSYDILIVGGGMVGASLAAALGDLPLRVGIIEKTPYRTSDQPSFNDRTIALAYGTSLIFKSLGIWDAVADVASPIRRIHISDRGHFGATRLDCQQMHTDALGYVIESRALGQVLEQQLQQNSQVDFICPASVESIEITASEAVLSVNRDGEMQTLSAGLVVAADGTHSKIRACLGMQATTWEYGQSALISNVATEQPHAGTAFERFTDSGPLALLPMRPIIEGGDAISRCSLVWTLRDEDVQTYMAMPDAVFLQHLQKRFGRRLGAFTQVGQRSVYPLKMVRVQQHVQERVALIGNAAHTLHPVAGQGYNLGIRDVAVLSEVLHDAYANQQVLGSQEVLQRYAQWRQRDHRRVIAFTDGLVRLFTNPLLPVRLARGLGLTMLDLFPGIKQQFALRTMGLVGRLPRLARGLPARRSSQK